ncbi:hypothetical protein DFJ63DRAFT_335172 [Scheffersomyces coipomensis]|uniref:uncharacterized protein n=1 Tax=Scheffersomyces coipomensis TaxID=1788519 RepID=UPI00315C4FAE
MAVGTEALHDGIDSTNLASTTEFFPDISQFEDEIEEEQDNIITIPDSILRQLGLFQSKLEAIESSSFGRRKTGTSSLFSFRASLIFALANECFGYNGWSSRVIECGMTFSDFDETNGKFSASYSALVRVTLGDGTYVDEYGYGDGKNLPYKYMCYSVATKQAITDAKKNAIIRLREVLIEYEMAKLDAQLKSDFVKNRY